MKNELNFQHLKAIIIAMLITFVFVACGDKDRPNDDETNMLVGKWECTLDSYGDPWDEPLIILFDSDGTGYQWFSEEPFSERWEFNYVATSSKLKIKT